MARIQANMAMDINNDFIRGRINSPSKVSSRSILVTSNASSILYYERIKTNNDLPDEEIRNPIDSWKLSYKDEDKASNSVRKMTDKDSTKNQQCVQNKAPAIKNIPTT